LAAAAVEPAAGAGAAASLAAAAAGAGTASADAGAAWAEDGLLPGSAAGAVAQPWRTKTAASATEVARSAAGTEGLIGIPWWQKVKRAAP
jgi:type IV secretory pathway TrbL component